MQRELPRRAIVSAGWVIFGVFCVLPISAVIAALASSPALGSVLTQLLTSERQQGLLTTTLMLTGAATVLATAVGVVLGIALARCTIARVWWARLFLTLPLLLPPYILALGAILLAGPSSYGLVGATVVMSAWLYPVPMLTTEAAIRRVDSRIEDAGWLVASPLRVWTYVTFPLIASAVAAAALIVFVLAISEFGVPGLLRVRVYTTEVFTAFAALYDTGRAAAVAIPLLVMATLVAFAAIRLVRHPTQTSERAMSGRLWTTPRQRAAVGALMLAGAGIMGPILWSLSVEARTGRTSWMAAVSSGALMTSVVWSALSAAVIVAVALVVGYSAARMEHHGRTIAETALVALFAIPPTLLGTGLVAIWNRPGWIGAVYQSTSMLLVAYLARFLPLAALLCVAVVRRIPESLEDAAAVCGASWLRSFRSIVVPLAARGIVGVWLIVFILALGELGVTVFVIAPGASTLPVHLYTLIANSPTADVARLALTQTAVILTVFVVFGSTWRLGRTRS
jgi:iron(III) transport system permease protein